MGRGEGGQSLYLCTTDFMNGVTSNRCGNVKTEQSLLFIAESVVRAIVLNALPESFEHLQFSIVEEIHIAQILNGARE